MIVPKVTATANRVTGVAGQRSSFKVPGGALSQAAVAKGRQFEQLSKQASQWGQVAYKMHRDTVVTAAVTAATEEIDDAFIKAQRQSLSDPQYEDQGGGILGFYGTAVSQILARSQTASRDPLTRRRIAAGVSKHANAQERTLKNYNAGRLLDVTNAGLNASRAEGIKTAANSLPPDWDGDENSLPTAVWQVIFDQEIAQYSAAGIGAKTQVAAEQANRDMRGDIAQYSVNTRVTAATTAQHTDDLLDLLDDPTKFVWLEPDSRDRLIRTVRSRRDRFLSAEYRQDTRERAEKNRQLKERQSRRALSFIQRITESRTGAASAPPPLTEPEIMAIADLDNGQGMAISDVKMLIHMANDTGAQESDPVFLGELHNEVLAIPADASDGERASAIDAIVARSTGQLAKGADSLVTIEQHLSFLKWAEGVKSGALNTTEINNVRNSVINAVAPRDITSGILEDARDVILEIDARYFFDRQIERGATPQSAAESTLQRYGITRDTTEAPSSREGKSLRPAFPVGVPSKLRSGALEVPSDTADWSPAIVEEARAWVNANKTQDSFGSTNDQKAQKYKRLMEDLANIDKFLAAGD